MVNDKEGYNCGVSIARYKKVKKNRWGVCDLKILLVKTRYWYETVEHF